MFSLQVYLLAVIASSLDLPSKLPQVQGPNPFSDPQKHGYGIIGGQSEDIKKYPYTVAVYKHAIDRLVGGGAIVNKNWIVCSACEVIGSLPEMLSVRVGSSNGGYGGQYLNISKLVMHENFSLDYPYDIALLKTMKPIKLGKEAKAVTLAKSVPKAGTVAHVSGFGKPLNPSETVINLMAADVAVLPQSECEKHHSSLETSFCADADGVGPCTADMGDPLVYNQVLIGLYIGGDICNYRGKPELYTDVSALRPWIQETIKQHSEEEMDGIFEQDYGLDCGQ